MQCDVCPVLTWLPMWFANDTFTVGARHAILSNSVLPVFLYLRRFGRRFFIWFALKNYLHCTSYGFAMHILHCSVFGHGFVLVSPRIPLKFSCLSLQCVTDKIAMSRHHKNASVSLASVLCMPEPFI